MESKLQRLNAELLEHEERSSEQAAALEQAATQLSSSNERLLEAESKLQELYNGKEGSGELVEGARREAERRAEEAERRAEEAESRLAESMKNEGELRDGLSHQQAVHEALQKETMIGQEVLKETLKNLESKSLLLEQTQAELNDKMSEIIELRDKVFSLPPSATHPPSPFLPPLLPTLSLPLSPSCSLPPSLARYLLLPDLVPSSTWLRQSWRGCRGR
eukprot:763808-Hanusia_phi.AAC.2